MCFVTPFLSLLTTKYQFTDIIVQKDNINVTNGTNVHLLVVFLISYCYLRAKKSSIYKKNIWRFFTHIHRYFTSKYQVTEIILQKDNVNVANGTNIFSICPVRNALFCLKNKKNCIHLKCLWCLFILSYTKMS